MGDMCHVRSTPISIICCHVTQDFLESEGIELNLPEEIPTDPYTELRREPDRTYITPPDFDKLKQFLTMDRKVTFIIWHQWDPNRCQHGSADSVIHDNILAA